MPYGITQCYLPPDTTQVNTPRLNGWGKAYPGGMEGWDDEWLDSSLTGSKTCDLFDRKSDALTAAPPRHLPIYHRAYKITLNQWFLIHQTHSVWQWTPLNMCCTKPSFTDLVFVSQNQTKRISFSHSSENVKYQWCFDTPDLWNNLK